MAELWADFLISSVCYEETATTKHIKKLKIHIDRITETGPARIWTRQEVINFIGKGYTFKTVRTVNDKWVEGAEIQVVEIDGVKYLRTLRDKTKKDNLGELPTFEC